MEDERYVFGNMAAIKQFPPKPHSQLSHVSRWHTQNWAQRIEYEMCRPPRIRVERSRLYESLRRVLIVSVQLHNDITWLDVGIIVWYAETGAIVQGVNSGKISFVRRFEIGEVLWYTYSVIFVWESNYIPLIWTTIRASLNGATAEEEILSETPPNYKLKLCRLVHRRLRFCMFAFFPCRIIREFFDVFDHPHH
jgi:hypothetical protein